MAHAHHEPSAVGGKLLDPLMKICLALFGIAAAIIAYRVFAGIGPVSAMSDGYAWGIWEPVNVVVFTGIGAGAYSVGLLCYVLNQGKYHPLVRPACLLGAIAYTLGGSSIMIALGRYWNAYWLGLPWMWNLGSVLLEVAVCVIAYVSVLWIEVLPSVFDGAAQSKSPGWAAFGKKWGARLGKAMPFIIALAMVLPTMHQSSLGGLMMIAVTKVHPLWHTALLPTLGLVSCLSMGFGAVVVLTTILKYTWKAEADTKLFASLSKVNGGLLFLFSALRLGDLAVHGKFKHLADGGHKPFFFLLETVLFLAPAVMFFMPSVQKNRGKLFRAALMAVAAGALWRVDAYLTAFDAGPGWEYMPSLGETFVTLGMAGIGMAIFLAISRLFPVVTLSSPQTSHLKLGRTGTASGR